MNVPETKGPVDGSDIRKVLLGVFVATFDVYLRSAAEIAAETGLSREVTVETLMSYCLSLAESDELITGFLRGDLTIVSLNEQTRQMVERDTRVLGLVAVGSPTAPSPAAASGPIRLGKKLELRKRAEAAGRPNEKASALEAFIRENPAIFAQVKAASHEFLVRWVMFYLMRETKARERGHQVAHEFWKRFPEVREKIEALAADRSGLRERLSRSPLGTRIGAL